MPSSESTSNDRVCHDATQRRRNKKKKTAVKSMRRPASANDPQRRCAVFSSAPAASSSSSAAAAAAAAKVFSRPIAAIFARPPIGSTLGFSLEVVHRLANAAWPFGRRTFRFPRHHHHHPHHHHRLSFVSGFAVVARRRSTFAESLTVRIEEMLRPSHQSID